MFDNAITTKCGKSVSVDCFEAYESDYDAAFARAAEVGRPVYAMIESTHHTEDALVRLNVGDGIPSNAIYLMVPHEDISAHEVHGDTIHLEDEKITYCPMCDCLADNYNGGGVICSNPDCDWKQDAQAKRLESIENDVVQLEVIECGCGFHLGIDATYLDQVGDFKIACPSCKAVIDTAVVCPE